MRVPHSQSRPHFRVLAASSVHHATARNASSAVAGGTRNSTGRARVAGVKAMPLRCQPTTERIAAPRARRRACRDLTRCHRVLVEWIECARVVAGAMLVSTPMHAPRTVRPVSRGARARAVNTW